MSGSVNKVMLVGNVVRDPEVRNTQDGRKIVNLTLATSESWKDKNTGEKKEKSEFHRVVIFNEGLAKVAEAYVKKGSKLYIEGQLQTRKWTDQAGVEKYSTEVVLQNYKGELTLLDSKGERQEQSAADIEKEVQKTFPGAKAKSLDSALFPDEEVPF